MNRSEFNNNLKLYQFMKRVVPTTMRRKHVSALSSATCLSMVVAVLLLTRQAKLRYDDVKKFHRLQDYAGQVNSVSESLQALEESAQALEEDVNQLKQLAQENLKKTEIYTNVGNSSS